MGRAPGARAQRALGEPHPRKSSDPASPDPTRLHERRPKERAFRVGSRESLAPCPPTPGPPSAWPEQMKTLKTEKKKKEREIKKGKMHGEKDRKHRPVLGQRKKQHLLLKLYRRVSTFPLRHFLQEQSLLEEVSPGTHLARRRACPGHGLRDAPDTALPQSSPRPVRALPLLPAAPLPRAAAPRRRADTEHTAGLLGAHCTRAKHRARLAPAAGSASRGTGPGDAFAKGTPSPARSQHSPTAQSTTPRV